MGNLITKISNFLRRRWLPRPCHRRRRYSSDSSTSSFERRLRPRSPDPARPIPWLWHQGARWSSAETPGPRPTSSRVGLTTRFSPGGPAVGGAPLVEEQARFLQVVQNTRRILATPPAPGSAQGRASARQQVPRGPEEEEEENSRLEYRVEVVQRGMVWSGYRDEALAPSDASGSTMPGLPKDPQPGPSGTQGSTVAGAGPEPEVGSEGSSSAPVPALLKLGKRRRPMPAPLPLPQHLYLRPSWGRLETPPNAKFPRLDVRSKMSISRPDDQAASRFSEALSRYMNRPPRASTGTPSNTPASQTGSASQSPVAADAICQCAEALGHYITRFTTPGPANPNSE